MVCNCSLTATDSGRKACKRHDVQTWIVPDVASLGLNLC
jgi:hypothetical protein